MGGLKLFVIFKTTYTNECIKPFSTGSLMEGGNVSLYLSPPTHLN